jgi:spermidine synthase
VTSVPNHRSAGESPGGGPAPADARPVDAARFSLGLISFGLAAWQIALTRVSSVLVYTQTTFLVLSVSIAAIGAGAAWVHWWRSRRGREIPLAAIRRLALLTGFFATVSWVLVIRVRLAFEGGVFALPFLFAGACLATAYVWIGARPSLTYAFELGGGAAGVAAALFLLPRIGDVNTGLVASTLAALAALPISKGLSRATPALMAVAPAVLLALNLRVPEGVLVVDPYEVVTFEPHLVWQTGPRHGRVVATAYDDFVRTDLVETDEPWVRYLYIDRMYTARVVRWDGRSPRFDDPEPERLVALKALPFRNGRPQRVLVLGAGGGLDVALALQGGAAHITAVEINGASIRFTRALSKFSGRLFERSEVRVVREDARRFLRDDGGRYDLIELSLLQNDPAVGRSLVARQNWIFTVEAMEAYLSHLAPDGVVVVVQNSADLADKTVATALAAFRRLGVPSTDAMLRMLVLTSGASDENPFSDLVLIGKQPVEPATVERLLEGADRHIVVRWAPGRRAFEPYRSLASGTTTPEVWVARSGLNLTPATDESPFFFSLDRSAGAGYIRLGGAGLACLALLAGADTFRRRRAAASLPLSGWGAGAALGLGFILLQAGLIHRADFLLGNTTLAVALGVGGMFVFGSLGALLAVTATGGKASSRLALFAVATAAALAAAGGLWDTVSGASAGKGDAALILSLAALFALPTTAAGACFPAVIERWAGPRQRAAAAVYAADGLGSVTGGALAAVVALLFGIRSLFLAAIACYALCAVLALGTVRLARRRAPAPSAPAIGRPESSAP